MSESNLFYMISFIEVMSPTKMESDLFMDATADSEDLVNQVSFTDNSENNRHNNGPCTDDSDVGSRLAVSPHNKPNHLPKISPGSRTLDSPICASSPAALLRSTGLSSLYPLPSPVSMLEDFQCKEQPMEDREITEQKLRHDDRIGDDTKIKVKLEDLDISNELDKKITFKNENSNNNNNGRDQLKCDEMLEHKSSSNKRSNVSNMADDMEGKEEQDKDGSDINSQDALVLSENVVAQVSSACASSSAISNSTESSKRGFMVSRRGGRAGRGSFSPPCAGTSTSPSVRNSNTENNQTCSNGESSKSVGEISEITPLHGKLHLSTGSARSAVSVDTYESTRIAKIARKQGSPHSLTSIVTASENQSAIHVSESSSSSCSHSPHVQDKNHPEMPAFLNEQDRRNVHSHQPENHRENTLGANCQSQDSEKLRTDFEMNQETIQDNSHEVISLEVNNLPVSSIDESLTNKDMIISDSPTCPDKEHDENQLAFPLSPPPSNSIPASKHGDGNHKSNNQLHFPDGKSDLPSALFLSPFSQSSLGIIGDSPFAQSSNAKDPLNIGENISIPLMSPPLSSAARERTETETPTNFVNELDKANPSFSWLNSPSIFPLTPKGFDPDAQNKLDLSATPVFAASFFSQETAEQSTKTTAKFKKVQNHHPYSSMICISPLASSKKHNRNDVAKNPKSSASPKSRDSNRDTMDIFQEIFASPRLPNNQNVSPPPHGMVPLDFNGKSEGDSNSNLDIHMAERDLMEDEDLSVLLHLASNPIASSSAPPSSSHYHRPRQRQVYSPSSKVTPSSLQIPLINNEARGSGSPERRNAQTRDYNRSQFPIPMIRRRRSSSKDVNQPQLGVGNNVDSSFGSNMANYPNSEEKKHPNKRRSSNVMLKPHFDTHSSFPQYGIPANDPNTGVKAPISSHNMSNPNMEFISSAPASTNPPHLSQSLQRQSSSGHRMQQHPMSSVQRHQNPANYPMSYDSNKSVYPPIPLDVMSSQPIYHPHCDQQGHIPMSLTPYADQLKKKAPQNKRGPSEGGRGKKKQRNDSAKSKKNSNLNKQTASQTKVNKESSVTAGSFPTIDLAATAASGGKNAQAAALAAAILRGVTMRPSGKWQAQLYYAGKSRYIGVFDSREKAALAYEIAREKLKSEGSADNLGVVDTEAAVKLAREAAFEGVNEPDHKLQNKR